MATTQSSDLTHDILFVNFNRSYSSLFIGMTSGCKIIDLTKIPVIEEICLRRVKKIHLLERLRSEALVACVSESSPNKLLMYNIKEDKELCSYMFPNKILAVKFNKTFLVVLLENMFCVYALHQMKKKLCNISIPPNPRSIFALAVEESSNMLVYPGSTHFGEVHIFDITQRKIKLFISAHNSIIAALSINKTATKLATASDKGTVIRVFSTVDGKKLYEFRRGVARYACIYSITFSPNSSFLAVSSNLETVHIFKLSEVVVEEGQNRDRTWLTYFGKVGSDCLNKVMNVSTGYLPEQVKNLVSMDRAFATAKIHFSDFRNTCALTIIDKKLRLVVASVGGLLYIFDFNLAEGGECTLIQKHRLDEDIVTNSENIKSHNERKADWW